MLVKLQDIQRILLKPTWAFKDQESFYKVYNEINSLPTYNPEQVIKDMIEEYKWDIWVEYEDKFRRPVIRNILKEALSSITNQ